MRTFIRDVIRQIYNNDVPPKLEAEMSSIVDSIEERIIQKQETGNFFERLYFREPSYMLEQFIQGYMQGRIEAYVELALTCLENDFSSRSDKLQTTVKAITDYDALGELMIFLRKIRPYEEVEAFIEQLISKYPNATKPLNLESKETAVVR